MSADTVDAGGASGTRDPGIEATTYEVLRSRLERQAQALRSAATKLDAERREAFGGQTMELVGSERVLTENHCIARDMVALGDRLLFGYNVFIGLRTETRVEDVLSVHRIRRTDAGTIQFEAVPPPTGAVAPTTPTEIAAHAAAELTQFGAKAAAESEGGRADRADGGLFGSARFQRDFRELFQYYKHAQLVQLRARDMLLLAVFRVGERESDVKVLRWRLMPGGRVEYVDNRGDSDHVSPPLAPFEWTPTTRDDQVRGTHPHVSIYDEVFVETIGGDLTVKVENNTDSGQGIFSEPVEYPDQTLDDADISYGRIGDIIFVRILPYRESQPRYLLYNALTRSARRIDALGRGIAELPERHGVVFPGGYALSTGEVVEFDVDTSGMRLDRTIRSPNGEDVLFAYHQDTDGRYLLMSYNIVGKTVDTPLTCHGYSLFDDGTLVVFRAGSEEPVRVHPVAIWKSPYTSELHTQKAPRGDGFLHTVGNAELVRGISDCLSVCRLVAEQTPTLRTYQTLLAAIARSTDAHPWLRRAEALPIREALEAVRASAMGAIDEFGKVEVLRERAGRALAEAERAQEVLLRQVRLPRWTALEPYLEALTSLRAQRGSLAQLADVRHIDASALAKMDDALVDALAELSGHTTKFLQQPDALAPLHAKVEAIDAKIDGLSRGRDAERLEEDLGTLSDRLAVLSETVAGLDVDDATVRTQILDGIGELFGRLNRTRARLRGQRAQLSRQEGEAQFGADLRLLAQSVSAALAISDTPEACEEALGRLVAQLEELEGRYGESDDWVAQLAVRRQEIEEGFAGRRQTLLEERQRRAEAIVAAAERILAAAERRGQTFSDEQALHAFFTADPMVQKLRDLATRLRETGHGPRGDELLAKLRAQRDDSLRALRDKSDLQDSEGTLRFGRHRFTINTTAPSVALVFRRDQPQLHVTGTDFYEPLPGDALGEYADLWGQTSVAETAEVYRGETLAVDVVLAARENQRAGGMEGLRAAQRSSDGLLPLFRAEAASRIDEGYERGVHDVDAASIADKLLSVLESAGPLQFSGTARAWAALYWADRCAARAPGDEPSGTDVWVIRARAAAHVHTHFGVVDERDRLGAEVAQSMWEFAKLHGIPMDEGAARTAADVLVGVLGQQTPKFPASDKADRLTERFRNTLRSRAWEAEFQSQFEALRPHVTEAFRMVRAWMTASLGASDREAAPSGEPAADPESLMEAAARWVTEGPLAGPLAWETHHGVHEVRIHGLLGQHPRIRQGELLLRLDETLDRVGRFVRVGMPRFRAYQLARTAAVQRAAQRLRLDELRPKVMSHFVRNRLIDEVYLPLIGDNLARQIGVASEDSGGARMGLLLLISPPGYGKTTLMEYVANRLGMLFVKVNGPALGHEVTSLDPAEAPSATARQEVERINFALEMGNNALLYLDDIQHTHPELLQKFISLCDAQRKIEGVWRGESRTYDLRGKRFAVVMAGNPYTESGARFQIPDMLANRADAYNLGDVLDGRDDLFKLSYLENTLTCNPVLAPLSSRSRADVMAFLRYAQGESLDDADLEHDYSGIERDEIRGVLERLWKIQEVLASVNRAYIESAAQQDDYRTEPPFKLQGSYRNMVKMASRVTAAMNDDELERLIDDHYLGEAQTLTSGTEQNLLKLAELRGRLTPAQAERWAAMKLEFRRRSLLGGGDDDPAVRVTRQLSALGANVDSIAKAIQAAATLRPAPVAERESPSEGASNKAYELSEPLIRLVQKTLEALPVQIEVVNMPPPSYHELLAQQIHITEQLLVPLLRSAGHTIQGSKAVWDRLDVVVKELEQLRASNPEDPMRTKARAKPYRGRSSTGQGTPLPPSTRKPPEE